VQTNTGGANHIFKSTLPNHGFIDPLIAAEIFRQVPEKPQG